MSETLLWQSFQGIRKETIMVGLCSMFVSNMLENSGFEGACVGAVRAFDILQAIVVVHMRLQVTLCMSAVVAQ